VWALVNFHPAIQIGKKRNRIMEIAVIVEKCISSLSFNKTKRSREIISRRINESDFVKRTPAVTANVFD